MHAVNEVRRPVGRVRGWGEHPSTGLGFEEAAVRTSAGRIPPESHAGGRSINKR